MRSAPSTIACLLAAVSALGTVARATATQTFTEISAAAGLTHQHGYIDGAPTDEPRRIAGGVASGDYDRDGWVDLYVVRGDIGPNLLFQNQGDGTFAEVGAAAGVDLIGTGTGPIFADIDGDGWLDLLVLGVGPSRPHLFRNRGDRTFEDITAASGLVFTRDSFSAAFGDLDGDNDLDLYVSHWGSSVRNFSNDSLERLWQNDGGGRFTDVTSGSNLVLRPNSLSPPIPGRMRDLTFAPNFADLDRDGDLDLLVTGDDGTSGAYRNEGGLVFTDITTSAISDENGMGSAIGDYDGDGDLDWFVSSIWDPDGIPNDRDWFVTGNRLYRNRGDGIFDDATDAAGVRFGYWGWASTFVDLNLDGHLDLVHVNGYPDPLSLPEFGADPTRVYLSNGDATFSERATALGLADRGQGRGLVAFDYDRDGDVDLFVANNGEPGRLYRNDLTPRPHFLVAKLRGPAGNADAVGAWITLTAGGHRRVIQLRAGSNFASNDPIEAHFGLGDTTTVDTLEVLWPDGARSELQNLTVDRFLIIEHPSLTNTCGDATKCIMGGTSRTSDCLLQTRATPPSTRKLVVCTEGDPTCDADPDAGNGVCHLRVTWCIERSDGKLPGCPVGRIRSLQVDQPLPTTAADATSALQMLATQIVVPERFERAQEGTCTTSRPFTLSLRRRGRRLLPVTLRVGATALAVDGRTDSDRVVLQCRPARGPRE